MLGKKMKRLNCNLVLWFKSHLFNQDLFFMPANVQSVSTICCIFHSTALRPPRCSFWRRLRGAVRRWRGWRSRWRAPRSAAPPRSPRVRSPNSGSCSSKRTTRWEPPRTRSTPRSTSWNGERSMKVRLQLVAAHWDYLTESSARTKHRSESCACIGEHTHTHKPKSWPSRD